MKSRFSKFVAFALGVTLLSATFPASTSASSSDLTGKKICIDPGHGGSDPGAVNTEYNLTESAINLDVSYGLKWLLENSGAEVVLTRTDDTYKDNRDRYTFCNNEEAIILISVHTNSVVDPTWDGSMALYFHPDEDDTVLAQTIYDVMYPALKATAPDPDNFRSFGLDWFASGVLLKSNMPATMLEPLFMSNPAEAELLVQNIFQNPVENTFSDGCVNFTCRRGDIAQAIHQGILSYFDTVASGIMHISSIDMTYDQKSKNYFIYSEVAVVGSGNNPVPGADVMVKLSQPNGEETTLSEISGIDGIAEFKLKVTQTGEYELLIMNLSMEGWEYDVQANMETSALLDIP